MKTFFRKLHKTTSGEINNYQYKGADHIILTCSQLLVLKKYNDAISLYEKFESEIILSEFEIAGIVIMIEVCGKNSDQKKMLHFTNKLKTLVPDHPLLIELNRN